MKHQTHQRKKKLCCGQCWLATHWRQLCSPGMSSLTFFWVWSRWWKS
jgi:hypothetical protein